jgi:TonB-linked SusC/RagA family outer membrane protein
MKLKLTWLLTLCMAFVMQFSFAQEKTVTGTVTEVATGQPAAGVTILVDGTTRGTQTDFDGNYSIKVNSGEVLTFSFIGLKTVKVTVGAADVYDVAMEDDVAQLDEVVIVGYGTSTKQAFAGTATSVKAENIENKNFTNVSQSLAGEAAGVQVFNTSGQPGTTSTVRIRGFGSINGNRAPLYVVDGVPYSGSLNAINPADIANTTVLKDATATAIYGSRGANGVILITTKSGSATESFVEVDVRTGINTQIIPRYDVITSPEESIALAWEAKRNRELLLNPSLGVDGAGALASERLFGAGVVPGGYLAPGYNMWNAPGNEVIDLETGQVRAGTTRKYDPLSYADEAFNPAFRYEANVRVGGGNEKSRYFLSAGFLDDNGYAINTSYKRYSSRLNLSSQVKDWLKVGANIGYVVSETLANGQTDGAENLFEFADKTNPFYPVYLFDDDGNPVADPIFGGQQLDYGSTSGFRDRPNSNNLNPIGSALYDLNQTDRNEVVANFDMTINIAEGLTFETNFGAQYANNVFKSVGNEFYGVSAPQGGDLFQSVTETFTYNALQLLRYKREFGAHSFEVLAAHEANDFSSENYTDFKGKSVLPGATDLDLYLNQLSNSTGFTEGRTLESYFGQLNYDFDDRFYFTGSIRRDGSSRFANDKWDTFWSLGGAWVISNESWLSGNDFLRFLKVKGSYGTTGDENGVGFFTGVNTFNPSLLGNEAAIRPRTFEDPNLTWERASQWQVGAEFSLGSFLDGVIDYYQKDTENLIFERRVSPSTGVAVIVTNDGELRNSGLEFDMNFHLVNTQDVTLDLSVNGAVYDNEITVMPLDPETGEPALFQNVGAYGYEQGRSIFDFYMREYAGVDPADGYPMWYEYYDDINSNGVLDPGEELRNNEGVPDGSLTPYVNANPDANIQRTVTKTYANSTELYINKSSIPDLAGAFRLAGKFGNFNVNMQFTYSMGGYAYDSQYAELMHDNNGGILATNRHKDVRSRWRQPGDITSVPLIADRVIPNINSQSSRFITKTDFIALNNILVGYDLPRKVLGKSGIDMVNIYASGDNLFISSAREGFNPQTSQTGNSGRGLYAPLTTITVGARLKF